MRILVVEDDEAVLTMLGTWLRTLGHEALLAVDGLQGIMVFNEQKPDLVITDCWMPQVNGATLTHHVKSQDQNTPVIMLTGFSERFSRAEAERLGANEYMQKPINLERLQQVIEMYDRYYTTIPPVPVL
jgi:DNA-binding response OmpR family regulator